jgi:predicted ATPase
MTIHLRSITLLHRDEEEPTGFPFYLPLVRSLETLEFNSPVTFFVGENGSGKSTLLEAIACAVGSVTVGSESVTTDKTLADVRRLAAQLRTSWTHRTHKGFFLRAEDFFGYARKLSQTRAELEEDLRNADRETQGRSITAAQYARMPYAHELNDLNQRYGAGLEAHSHGESFLALFQSRFVPGGLYQLDEPEAPLSPIRQMAMISILREMVAQDSQFIIATHSPILMAFPEALIYNFDRLPLQTVRYADLEHVRLTRDFLDNPDAYLSRL